MRKLVRPDSEPPSLGAALPPSMLDRIPGAAMIIDTYWTSGPFARVNLLRDRIAPDFPATLEWLVWH